MISTGNDIVSLRSVDKTRTNEFRFYSKILSASEQGLYHQLEHISLPFENYVWLLWAVKESSYKFLKRIYSGLVFSPTKITITHIEIPSQQLLIKSGDQWENANSDEDFYTGKVQYGSDTFYFRSKVTREWISAVVNESENFENVCWGIRSIDDAGYEYQSKAARLFLLNKLNTIYEGNLEIDKSPVGYPVILKDSENMNIPVSLAHDGLFVAYSFILYPLNTN